jgi:hypothetical protein
MKAGRSFLSPVIPRRYLSRTAMTTKQKRTSGHSLRAEVSRGRTILEKFEAYKDVGMMALTETTDRQSLWSKTAAALKNVDLARWLTFLLSILEALLATIACQLDQPRPRLYIAIAGAGVLAIMTFLSSLLLSGTQVTNWIRLRASSREHDAHRWRCAPISASPRRMAHAGTESTNKDGLAILSCGIA